VRKALDADGPFDAIVLAVGRAGTARAGGRDQPASAAERDAAGARPGRAGCAVPQRRVVPGAAGGHQRRAHGKSPSRPSARFWRGWAGAARCRSPRSRSSKARRCIYTAASAAPDGSRQIDVMAGRRGDARRRAGAGARAGAAARSPRAPAICWRRGHERPARTHRRRHAGAAPGGRAGGAAARRAAPCRWLTRASTSRRRRIAPRSTTRCGPRRPENSIGWC